jgi:DNA-directed RNA polymerase specialized sigma subunit
LNKHSAAIEALKDYDSMKHILLSYSDDKTEVQEHLTSVYTPMLSWSAPGSKNPHAEEGKIALSLDLIDVVKDRYQQALEYMVWFQPAWDALSDDERIILAEIFMKNNDRTEAVLTVGERLHLERAQVYRRKDKAVSCLSLLLYGK